MVRYKSRWSVMYEGDVGSAGEWCQIKLHTSCDVPAPRNQLKTTVVDGARSIFAPTVVSRVLIKNISQKCSRDDGKMTLGGLHGHGMVHSSGVGAPMIPRGHVIHHQQTCTAQQQVVPTISRLS